MFSTIKEAGIFLLSWRWVQKETDNCSSREIIELQNIESSKRCGTAAAAAAGEMFTTVKTNAKRLQLLDDFNAQLDESQVIRTFHKPPMQ